MVVGASSSTDAGAVGQEKEREEPSSRSSWAVGRPEGGLVVVEDLNPTCIAMHV